MMRAILFLTLCVITPAHANAGLPMLFVIWPIFLFALIPVILIESLVFKFKMPELKWKSIFSSVGIANIISTVIGIPITWVVLVLIQLITPGGQGTYSGLSNPVIGLLSVTLQAPWLLPYESQFYWMIPCAFLFLMIFFFIMSIFSERWILFKMLKKSYSINQQETDNITLKANVYSYLFLISCSAIIFYYREIYSQFVVSFAAFVNKIF
ncbi:MAG: hypothetical protein KF798_02435 [Candidatus Paracaedibacteraceae bacterium]|nr:hypothetical protein [Candidatus Paracaedibacteraceae bacterium]